ncbi:hypothetical protein [Aureispira anguillae]|uniref:Lipocalin-like domain-containing protein n=1 Tax=Aureispira anguillae TaxID=2864201 RepID=A0A916DX32_9BACT|nr:hypothetical protein [Aureispira anguillae]BDS15340.1 hypothetical protein AsAng_0061240 [Aureispira anguillae]
MKKRLLLLSCVALFFFITGCKKARQIHLLSAHTWVVADHSTMGTIGDEYTFHDNRLFFQTTGALTIDGQWDTYPITHTPGKNRLDIQSDLGQMQYDILLLTATKLELSQAWNGSISPLKMILVPKK